MKIQGKEVDMEVNYLDLVTYVPGHAKGNAGHSDCQQGVIIRTSTESGTVFVLYSKTRTVQATNSEDLVWG